jgi:hypothetical protein
VRLRSGARAAGRRHRAGRKLPAHRNHAVRPAAGRGVRPREAARRRRRCRRRRGSHSASMARPLIGVAGGRVEPRATTCADSPLRARRPRRCANSRSTRARRRASVPGCRAARALGAR